MRKPTTIAQEAADHVAASNAAGMPPSRATLDSLVVEFMESTAYCLAEAGIEVDTEAEPA